MAQQNGKLSDAGAKAAIEALFKSGNLYMGYVTAPITDTDTLATITESTHIARFEMSAKLGTVANVANIPTLKNSAEIVSGNSTGAGEAIIGWYLTAVDTGAVGEILAYGNGDAVYTNTGVPITTAVDGLAISIN